MRILILGGTVFLGRHLVEAAVAGGHEVCLFNRGRSDPGLFEGQAEKIVGDRAGDLAALRGRRWDAVIDTLREAPALVERSAELLAETVERYVFVSTVSVYRDFGKTVHDEASPVVALPESSDDEGYPSLKVRSEEAVRRRFPERALIVRPGLIVGPHDPTDRFTYWVRRIAEGGETLVPGSPERPVQFIDARDLAAWMIRLLEGGTTGLFNAVGPEAPLSMGAFLSACRLPEAPEPQLRWVGEAFPLDQKLAPYSELPLWLPAADFPHANEIDGCRAFAAGLSLRPLHETIADTAAWDRARGRPALTAGLETAREARLLGTWTKD